MAANINEQFAIDTFLSWANETIFDDVMNRFVTDYTIHLGNFKFRKHCKMCDIKNMLNYPVHNFSVKYYEDIIIPNSDIRSAEDFDNIFRECMETEDFDNFLEKATDDEESEYVEL